RTLWGSRTLRLGGALSPTRTGSAGLCRGATLRGLRARGSLRTRTGRAARYRGGGFLGRLTGLLVHTGGWAINVTVTNILSAGAGARRGTTASSVAGILTRGTAGSCTAGARSEEHTSELQSRFDL